MVTLEEINGIRGRFLKCFQSGDYQQAEIEGRRVVEAIEAGYGLEHAFLVKASDELGLALYQLGRGASAEEAFRRAVDLATRLYGPEHEALHNPLNNLGLLLSDLDRLPEAAVCFERSLAIRRRVFGAEHDQVIGSLANLGRLQRLLGAPEKALALLDEAVGSADASGGSPDLGTILELRGLAQLDLGRYSDAEVSFDRARGFLGAKYGESHPLVVASVNGLGIALMRSGRSGDAEPLLARAAELARQQSHRDCAAYLGDLADVYSVQGKHRLELDTLLLLIERLDAQSAVAGRIRARIVALQARA